MLSLMDKFIRILVVDDHPTVREGLQRILAREEDMEVVGVSADGEKALFQAAMLHPDIALVDIAMPGMGGIELTRQLKEKHPYCNVIIFSVSNEYVDEAMEAGATGYLVKEAKCAELTRAIRQVYCGQVVISESIPSEIRDKYLGEKAREDPDAMEEVQLVLPPFEANQIMPLMSFIGRVDEVLGSPMVQMVGTLKEGTAITVALVKPRSLADFIDELREMPEVEEVQETIPAKGNLLGLLKKATAVPRQKPGPRKSILVTLKQEGLEKQSKDVK